MYSKAVLFGIFVLLAATADAARGVAGSGGEVDGEAKYKKNGLIECWNALLEIKSCSNEIVIYFLNGKTDLSAGCCRAIELINHDCWPPMLDVLGFTADEGNVLKGYCDAMTEEEEASANAPAGDSGISGYPSNNN